jgi:tungstate transport system permease protein
MRLLAEALRDALQLLFSLDPDLLTVVAMTLYVTGFALLLAVVLGLPLGIILGLRRPLPGASLLLPLVYTGMGLPPVVVGLLVYLLLSNRGVLGDWRWLFTPPAMILAQTILALPLVIGLTLTAVQSVDQSLRLQIRALGASRRQLAWTVLAEARLGVLAAIVAAFGRIVAEVGAVMLVGGNIEGQTRVLTTAIVLETRRGNFALALALGLILLSLAFSANFALYHLQRRGYGRE